MVYCSSELHTHAHTDIKGDKDRVNTHSLSQAGLQGIFTVEDIRHGGNRARRPSLVHAQVGHNHPLILEVVFGLGE